MNQTEQYALNQWAKDDRIQMEDFNADNLKVEQALAAEAAARTAGDLWVKLADYTAPAGGNRVSFPLASVTPAAYLTLLIAIIPPEETPGVTYLGRLDGATQYPFQSANETNGTTTDRLFSGNSACFLLLRSSPGVAMTNCTYHGNHPNGIRSLTFSGYYKHISQVQSLDLDAYSTALPAGFRFLVYGLKF